MSRILVVNVCFFCWKAVPPRLRHSPLRGHSHPFILILTEMGQTRVTGEKKQNNIDRDLTREAENVPF